MSSPNNVNNLVDWKDRDSLSNFQCGSGQQKFGSSSIFEKPSTQHLFSIIEVPISTRDRITVHEEALTRFILGHIDTRKGPSSRHS